MLQEFIRVHELDILLVQEFAQIILQDHLSYDIQYNIATSKRGTAIVAREGIRLANIIRLPSGRAIGASLRDTLIMNIYVPSGTAKRHEREHFYSTELAYLLTAASQLVLMGGDFNCVLERKDATGNFNYSRAVDGLVRGMALQDAWQGEVDPPGYTHYSVGGTARLDRIYISSDLLRGKQGMETLAAAFTDHLAMCLRMTVEEPIVRRCPGYWKMDVRILEDKTSTEQFKTLWDQLKRLKHAFPNAPTWWERACKRRIQYFLRKALADSRRDYRALENYYYERIYERLQQAAPNAEARTALQKLKAKIDQRHHSLRRT